MDQYSASAGRRLQQNNNNGGGNNNGGANLGQCWQQFYSVYPARCGRKTPSPARTHALGGRGMHCEPALGLHQGNWQKPFAE